MPLRVGEHMQVQDLMEYAELCEGVEFIDVDSAGRYPTAPGQYVARTGGPNGTRFEHTGSNVGWPRGDADFYINKWNIGQYLDISVKLIVVPIPADQPPPYAPAPGRIGTWGNVDHALLEGAVIGEAHVANVAHWVVRNGRLTSGPARPYLDNPFRPDPSWRFAYIAPTYDLEARLTEGGQMPVRDFRTMLDANPARYEGVQFDGAGNHANGDGRGYYMVQGGAIVQGPRVTARINACPTDGIIIRFATVPEWAKNPMGPVYRTAPTPEKPCCPLCFYPGIFKHPDCPGHEIGKAFAVFAMAEECPRCHDMTWRGTLKIDEVGGHRCDTCVERRLTTRREGAQAEWMRFGIEIETEGIWFGDKAADVVKKGKKGWVAKADGSLRGPISKKTGQRQDAEITSPPLPYKPESLYQVRQMAQRLRNGGARTISGRCGVHVHVDVNDLTYKQLASLAEWWYLSQKVVHAAIPPLPSRAQYCAPWHINYLTHIRNCAERSRRDDMSRNPAARRYENLNYLAMGAHGTVEFRLFNGTVHGGKLLAYVALAVHTVARATREVISHQETLPPVYPATREGMIKLLDDLAIVDKSVRWHLMGTFARDEDRPYASKGVK